MITFNGDGSGVINGSPFSAGTTPADLLAMVMASTPTAPPQPVPLNVTVQAPAVTVQPPSVTVNAPDVSALQATVNALKTSVNAIPGAAKVP